jgi:multiple sugar transport system ATP-binding protein
MAVVELKNVSKNFSGNIKAVDNVSLTVKDKEFVVLVGPSGCGKSTTLRMIAGLEEVSSGDILIDNQKVNSVSPKDRNIAMVFQNYALYPHMTVYDNMAFGLKLRRFSKEEIKERVVEAAKILDLESFLNRKPKALSGGQRQRVAVGRAIVRKPKVFLFDEPLSNLDAKLRVQMRTEISKLHQKLGATMIYVTHDQTEAMTMGERIVIMKDGIVNQVDTPLNLYNNPANIFVAGFIGSPAMNFIDGQIVYNDDIQFVSNKKDIDFILSKQQSEKLKNYIGKEITIGIRPENILLESVNHSSISVEVVLEVIEPMGNEIFLYFELDESLFTSRVKTQGNLIPGKKIKLFLERDKIYFFDKENGKNII